MSRNYDTHTRLSRDTLLYHRGVSRDTPHPRYRAASLDINHANEAFDVINIARATQLRFERGGFSHSFTHANLPPLPPVHD